MKNLNILIVDDEPPARKKLRSFLGKEQKVGLIAEAENGVEAVKCIHDKKPDLVFLDIQMPGMTGFEVIETIGIENMPPIVFVTAYDQYAIEAFEVQAVDYLLKPFDHERFSKSFKRALERVAVPKDHASVIQQAIDRINQGEKYLQRIMVNIGQRYFFIQVADIAYISAEEKYVNLHTEKRSYLIRNTMNRLEQRLDPAKFARIHRSYIVNVDFIKEMQPWSHGDYIVILNDGAKLTASRRFRERLFGQAKA